MLPKELAVCKCVAHKKKMEDVSKRNDFADKTAKEAAQGQFGFKATYHEIAEPIDHTVLKVMQQHAPQTQQTIGNIKGLLKIVKEFL